MVSGMIKDESPIGGGVKRVESPGEIVSVVSLCADTFPVKPRNAGRKKTISQPAAA
jgi:hypothetical protein